MRPSTKGASAALIVVDVQNCFLPGGSLAVKDGEQVVPVINKLAKAFSNVVMTQDWHTGGHISFASSHSGKKPFETVDLNYGKQVLWPDHCVQGTDDAALHKDLKLPTAQLIIRKGYNKGVDSYSAFEEADRKTVTGLAERWSKQPITLLDSPDVREGHAIIIRPKAGEAQDLLHTIADARREIPWTVVINPSQWDVSVLALEMHGCEVVNKDAEFTPHQ